MADDDQALLLAWREGDRRAGSQLISRHYRALFRFFASKVPSTDIAEDLVQQTFTGATTGLERFQQASSARTWLFAIARNILRQWIEKACRQRKYEGEPAGASAVDLGAGPSTVMRLKSEHQTLARALQRLPLESQVLLELVYWERLPAREVAVVFDCPEGTARTRIRKAKQELRGMLDELARSPAEAETSMRGLETWAKDIRVAWQGE